MSSDEQASRQRSSKQKKPPAPLSASSAAAAAVANNTPDDVLRMLESCQLSEQDTEELLKDAYALNRLLRAHLAHVESGDSQSQRDSATSVGSTSAAAESAGGAGAGFGRQLTGPERREQSSSRRTVSLSGRSTVTLTPSSQQQRLPPIRACSPGQRLSEMARVYNSGVIQPGHRSTGDSVGAVAGGSSKKRL